MLPKYRPVIDGFCAGVARALTVRLGLSDNLPLYEELMLAGYGQADVVLELLRLDLLPEVEALIGHPIQRLPARPVRPYPPLPRRAPSPDDARVLSVVRNPRLPTTPSFLRFQEFRPGVSISSLIKRGVTRKDIREARKNNWVTFEEVRA